MRSVYHARAELAVRKAGYLTNKQWEQRLRLYAREAAAEARETERAAKKLNRETRRKVIRLRRTLGKWGENTQHETRKFIRREMRRVRKLAELARVRSNVAVELARVAPSTKLSHTERTLVEAAIFAAMEKTGKETPGGLGLYLKYRQPALARQWINYYIYDLGEEPDWISSEDINEFYGRGI